MLLSPDHLRLNLYMWYITITSIWWSYMYPAIMGFQGMLCLVEYYHICPNLAGLHVVSSIYKSQKQSRNINVKPMVDFTRMNIGRFDKFNCDWCSIVNGTCDYAIQKIIAEIEHGGVNTILQMRLPRTARWLICYVNTVLIYLPGSASHLHRWTHGETLEMSPGYIAIHKGVEQCTEHRRYYGALAPIHHIRILF